MSDGPYKTLKMSPKWRALAKLAGNGAHSAAEVAEAVPAALAADWREIGQPFLRQMRAALGDDDRGMLLSEVAKQEVGRLRAQASNPMEALLADNAIDVLRDGYRGAAAFEEAAAATIAERADRGQRQVEEHYRREASQGKAADIRVRLTDSMAAANLRGLASALVAGVPVRDLTPSVDRSGLDEGVSL
ncbi:hypothetical protein [Phenylobacterium sp.]|uniref:hypothetical protein n=1 Tax=Phenylobacterium sp. TaxID=1871053 RepID=UPI0025FA35FA|nr:hypothetical protein [Phenylobacterium sp.]MBX3482400.1 hypothetical protein [Phenylobacterium sp.]MCW5758193.1 hypothetical protein [Phenylobacterium sp.]